jgi:hypothetical protein
MEYLKYCIESCDWSAAQFTLVNETGRRKALRTLLASPKWQSLSAFDRKFLSEQVK